jgi:hypothetical protein
MLSPRDHCRFSDEFAFALDHFIINEPGRTANGIVDSTNETFSKPNETSLASGCEARSESDEASPGRPKRQPRISSFGILGFLMF